MRKNISSKTKRIILSGASALALVASSAVFNFVADGDFSIGSAAYAQESGQQGSDKAKQRRGEGGGKKGSEAAGAGSDVPGGQGGPSDDSDAKGPQYKGGGDQTGPDSGGKPPWAQEGLPQVELGRLNVARAPNTVFERALNEAYDTNLDKDDDGVMDADADLSVIDSPIANLSLYSEALAGERQVDGSWTLLDATTFLGAAADKYVPVSTETVQAIDIILGFGDYDYSAFTYDRSDVYGSELTAVFGDVDYEGTGLEAFAQAADDARAIIVYYHDL